MNLENIINKTKKSLKNLVYSTIIGLALAGGIKANAEVLYVDAKAQGLNNGSSWSDAYNYLQDALIVAQTGDEIQAAQGIYKPDEGEGIILGSRGATFQLKNGVTLKGGFAGFGQPDPDARDIKNHKTILSGDLNEDDGNNFINYEENSNHVVTGSNTDETAILDGFIVTGGNDSVYDSSTPRVGGAGMFNIRGNPTVISCTFQHNLSVNWGGGMYNEKSNLSLENCVFNKNKADGAGGISNINSSPTISNCIFNSNSAGYLSGHDGGGVGNGGDSDPFLLNCIFTGNSADYGAGLNNNDNSDPTLINCIFTRNLSKLIGGGVCDSQASSPKLFNCTFSKNSGIAFAYYGGENSKPELTNCILWGDTPIEMSAESSLGSSLPVINYCDIQGGWPEGIGNINTDPLFTNPNPNSNTLDTLLEEGDFNWAMTYFKDCFNIQPNSTCIDPGDPYYVPKTNTDIDGNRRVIRRRVDMGAYEFVPVIPAIVEIYPETLNLISRGIWVTSHIQSEDYNIYEIEPNSLVLENKILAEKVFFDTENDQVVAKFSRSAIQNILNIGEVELTINGEFYDGVRFEGTDTIRVIGNNFKNFGIFANYWLQKGSELEGDINNDKIVNYEDLGTFVNNWLAYNP